MPTTVGSQVKPCCSRLDLYKQHAGLDLRDMFPADEAKYDKAQTDKWNWDALPQVRRRSCTRPAIPVGLPMGQTSDAVDWVGALFHAFGVVMIDDKDNIKVDSARPGRRSNISRS